MSNNHKKYMQRCLQLALNGEPTVSPNPMVGSVVVHNEKIIGEGWHYQSGLPHAEVNAINAVRDPGLLKDSTLYISLEPCAHHGKTPPCTDLILEKEIPRVVVACRDKNSAVRGKGIEKLQKNGVSVLEGILEEEALYLNRKFFTFHEKKRPFILLKWAQTLDGYLDIERAPYQKGTQWITRPETRVFVHRQRSICDAIMVGSRTVINDNPKLAVEEVEGRHPMRLILDPDLETDPDAMVYRNDNYRIFTLQDTDRPNVTKLDKDEPFLEQVLSDRYVLGTQSILVEGGSHTHKTFIESKLWDEAYVLVGKKTFGTGLPAPKIPQEAEEINNIGEDKILRYSRL